MKEISIIIATYNAKKSIKNCLECIGTQKNSDIELVVIDGNSTDGTYDIIKNYDFVDKSISERDSGIYDAWNKGIEMAEGRWIMFVGADDIILPNTLKDYALFAKEISSEIDIITANSRFVDLDGNLIKIIGRPYSWCEYRRNMEIAHGTTLHNRNLFKEVGYYNINYKVCADYELLMRKGPMIKGAYYDKTVMEFRIGGASFSFRCQKETFAIRKKYNSVDAFTNMYLFCKRIGGICVKKLRFQTKEI